MLVPSSRSQLLTPSSRELTTTTRAFRRRRPQESSICPITLALRPRAEGSLIRERNMDASNNPVNAAISMLDATKNDKWYICRPLSVEAAVAAPSECSEYFIVSKIESDDPVVTAFIEAVKSIFTKNAHKESYWQEVALETEMSLSRSVIGYRDTQLESHTRESLLSPVLCQITARMTLLPSCNLTSFKAFLQPECPIKLHDKGGRPASVDYAINLEGGNQLIKCIPVEAKRVFSIPSLKQLSSYINKLSTCKEFKNDAVVGLMMTQFQFYFAFSPLKFGSNDEAVPVVYVSPCIEWRSEGSINSEGLLLMSTVHLIKLERLIYDVADPDDMLLQVSKKLYEVPFQAETSSSKLTGPDATYRRMLLIQEQNDKIREQQKRLEENDRRLSKKQEELQATIKELEEKLEEVEKITSPKKRKGREGGTQEE